MIELKLLENGDDIPFAVNTIVSENKYFLDNGNFWKNKKDMRNLLRGYVEYPDCKVYIITMCGMVSGFIIFENIRKIGCDITATVHPCLGQVLWGRNAVELLKKLQDTLSYTTLHCEVPDIAIHTCRLTTNCNFKKVGVRHKALPYTNAYGETSLRDVYLYEWRKEDVE